MLRNNVNINDEGLKIVFTYEGGAMKFFGPVVGIQACAGPDEN
jgi:hypothetical protein